MDAAAGVPMDGTAAGTRLAVYFGLAFGKGFHDDNQYIQVGKFRKGR